MILVKPTPEDVRDPKEDCVVTKLSVLDKRSLILLLFFKIIDMYLFATIWYSLIPWLQFSRHEESEEFSDLKEK